jgi:hypothetical protein
MAPSRPANPANPASSTLVRALEDTWHTITTRHPQIPPAVIIIASGTEGKHPKWGHHAPERWRVNDDDRTEIMVSGEGLQRTPRQVLGTLLHEAAHALAYTRGIKDTSRQGRYHNKKYAQLAEELGIDIAKDDKLGWTITSVPNSTIEDYADEIHTLSTAMTLWRRAEITGGTTKRNSNLIAATCPCGRTIRIAKSTLEDAPVICGACGSEFEPKDA